MGAKRVGWMFLKGGDIKKGEEWKKGGADTRFHTMMPVFSPYLRFSFIHLHNKFDIYAWIEQIGDSY